MLVKELYITTISSEKKKPRNVVHKYRTEFIWPTEMAESLIVYDTTRIRLMDIAKTKLQQINNKICTATFKIATKIHTRINNHFKKETSNFVKYYFLLFVTID